MTDPGQLTRASRDGRCSRRRLLAGAASLLPASLAGCLRSPSSGGPPYDVHEIDGGAVYGPGLGDERPLAFFAALVADEAALADFDVDALTREEDREFITATDFETELLGVIQVSGVNSSRSFWVPDVARSDVNLTVIVAAEDPTPHSDDRVITTLLVRVTDTGGPIPDKISVELSLGDRVELFSGDRRETPTRRVGATAE